MKKMKNLKILITTNILVKYTIESIVKYTKITTQFKWFNLQTI